MIEINYLQIEAFINGLRPTEQLTVSEWSDKNRFLSSESSAEPGRWHTSRTPYLKKIMDVLSPTSLYKDVRAMKSSQLGFTEGALNCIGAFMDIAPCPIMYIMPTVNMAKGFSKSRVTPMIEACPSLTKKIRPARERDANNTVLEKSFAGGILILTGANSAAELSSRPIRVIMMDEIDRYPMNVDGEGSPMALAEKRALTFGNRKIFKLGTPTVQGISAIETELEGTDKQKYFVPLPCCGVPQSLEFEQLTWTEGKYNDVKYRCIHCGELNEERHKPKFLAAGEWIATEPQNTSKDVIGFIINGLYSPLGWLSWREIAKEYDEVKDKPVRLRTFTNTVLGRTFVEKSEAPAWKNIYDRREQYKIGSVPNRVVFITAGVDVQRDRIECEVVGWCKNKISYSIEYAVLFGDTAAPKVWSELKNFLMKNYLREDGMTLPVRCTAIDTGYNTNVVYSFCRKFDAGRVIPIKGQDNQSVIIKAPAAVDITRNGKKIGQTKVWNVGVSVVKYEFYGWLRLEIEPGQEEPEGYCHFPEYAQEYFKGLTAEAIEEVDDGRGYKKHRWAKKYERNEPLDCRIYARAAASQIGMDRLSGEMWDSLRGEIKEPVKPQATNEDQQQAQDPQPQPVRQKIKRKKSDYWD